MDLFLSFFLGVIASLLAAAIIKIYKSQVTKRKLKSVEGDWVELIHNQESRRISIGSFQYSFWDEKYHFNGNNFLNNGENYYSWKSERIFIDTNRQQVLYIYRVIDKQDPSLEKYGFGQISIELDDDQSWLPKTGYFVDTDRGVSPVRVMTLFRASDIAEKINFKLDPSDSHNQTLFVKAINESSIL